MFAYRTFQHATAVLAFVTCCSAFGQHVMPAMERAPRSAAQNTVANGVSSSLHEVAIRQMQHADANLATDADYWLGESRRGLALATGKPQQASVQPSVPLPAGRALGRMGVAALIEDAAGAAINGLQVAKTQRDEVAAFSLLVDILDTSGSTYAVQTLLASLENLPAEFRANVAARKPMPPPPTLKAAAEADIRTAFGQWTVLCDNTRGCTAVSMETVSPSSSSSAMQAALVLTRAAGPGAALRFYLVFARENSQANGVFRIGSQPMPQMTVAVRSRSHPGMFDASPAFLIPVAWNDSVLEQLVADGELAFHLSAEKSEVRFDLTAARDALRHIDTVQGRSGSKNALVERGKRNEARVPLAPDARTISLPGVVIKTVGSAVPADVTAFWRHVCSEASMIERTPPSASLMPQSLTLAEGTEFWRLPCRSGAYGMQYQIFYRYKGNLSSLAHPYRHDGIEPKTRLLNTPLFIQAQPHNLPLVLAQNGMLMDDRPHLPEPSDTRLPLLLVEEQDVGGQANHGRRVTWAWTGAWFERVREDVLLYVEDIRFHVPVYRDRWIASE